jgi:predicted dienelactone hydrolase
MTMRMPIGRPAALVGALLLLLAGDPAADSRPYDPLAVAGSPPAQTLDLVAVDTQRQREIPVRVYLPAGRIPAPVVLFSHGLGGSREGSAFLGRHWAGRGYVAVFLQHPGSDASVWQGVAPLQRMAALKKAAGIENFLLRVKDVPAVLDQIARWNAAGGHALAGRVDLTAIGMSGHSFGAVTTQALSGQAFPAADGSFTDARIRAAVVMSPSSPRRGADPGQAFGGVRIPWMLMTGTQDLSVIGDADLESRLAVYPALPPGGKYELVLDGAEHSVFTDRPLPGETGKRNPNHHRAILALSTAFWDAWLRRDPAARAWLDGAGPASVLEKKDRWQRK